MTDDAIKGQRPRGRPRHSVPHRRTTFAYAPDVYVFLERLHNATGIPITTLVNSIIRGYFTQRGAGNGIVLDVTPDYDVRVPIQWPTQHNGETNNE